MIVDLVKALCERVENKEGFTANEKALAMLDAESADKYIKEIEAKFDKFRDEVIELRAEVINVSNEYSKLYDKYYGG